VKPKVPAGRVFVPGYTKEDGTLVKGYYRQAGSGGNAPPTTSTAAQRQAQQALRRSPRK
jgi:hypothetical protein